MNLRYEEDKKADRWFAWSFFLNLVLGVVGLVGCFRPEPNNHWWLLLCVGAVLEVVLSCGVAFNCYEASTGLRKTCEETDEARKERIHELELARRYIREFPDQAKVLKRLKETGGEVRAAYLAKAHLLEHGLKGGGPGKFDPTSVDQTEASFRCRLAQASAAIGETEGVLRELHECALACHAEDVYPRWQDYAWSESATKQLK